MRNLFTVIVLVGFMLTACSSEKKVENKPEDSIADSSKEIIMNTVTDEPQSSDEVTDLNTTDINNKMEECRKNILDSSEQFYTVTISSSQYEASSSVIWHFDKSFSPRYFKDDWAMEGTEGSTEYFIDNNAIQCALDQESFGTGSTVTSWCQKTGGLLTTHEDESGIDTTEPLPATYNKQAEESFDRYYKVLKTLLKEGNVTDETSDSYQIKIENKPYEEYDFIEVTEISIPRELYNALI